MNTLEIVLLSLLAGLAVALLIVAVVYLAWMLHTVRKFLATVQTATLAASTDISLLRTQIESILNTHRQEMSAMISRINGDKLVEASNVIFRSAQRIETACVSFGQLATSMLSGEIVEPELTRAARSGLGPESYAPNPTGEKFIGQSRTAAQDSGELSDEGGDDREE